MRTKLLFVVAVVQLAIAASSPLGEQRLQAGNDNETGLLVITSAPPTCQPFAFPYCNSLGEGYNVTMFPNERGFGFNESRQEFNDFKSLMESGCSAKVRTLFCFFYFPFCVTMSYGGQTISKPVLPCRETCQEVRSNCQALLGNYSWPNWLDCSKDYFLPATSSNWTCANGALSPGGTREPPVPATTLPTVTSVTTESTTEPNAESTAEITTPTSAPCSCKKCKPRVNVSGKTFKNNAYTFGELLIIPLRRLCSACNRMCMFCACANGHSEHNRLGPSSNLIHTSNIFFNFFIHRFWRLYIGYCMHMCAHALGCRYAC